MSEQESKEIRTMRAMAWERAKGEMASMLQTYWQNDNFEHFESAMHKFVSAIEDNGWHE